MQRIVLARERQPSQTFWLGDRSCVRELQISSSLTLHSQPSPILPCNVRGQSVEPGAPGSQRQAPPPPPRHTGSQREERVGQQATHPGASLRRGSSIAGPLPKVNRQNAKEAQYVAFGEAGKKVWVKLQLFNHMWVVSIY